MNWETGSISSEVSGATGSDISDGKSKFLKRMTRTFYKDSISEAEDIDNGMRSLYQDPDILEQKCQLSMMSEPAATLDSLATLANTTTESGSTRLMPLQYSNKTAQSVIASLPEGYFTSGFDPVALLPDEIASWGEGDLTEQFMNKIEDVDTDKVLLLGLRMLGLRLSYDV
jgi:hypothetical protein